MRNKHAKVQSRVSRLVNFTQLSSCLPVAKSQAQTACPIGCSLNSGRCQSCWQSCKRPFKLNMALLVITLMYKSKGSKVLLDSCRPITLLNSDYKLPAKKLVVDSGYSLWACPPAGGPHSDRFCAWSVDWRQCIVSFGGGGVQLIVWLWYP